MRRTVLIVIAATAVMVATAVVALGKTAAVPKLKGTVGPGYTITLINSSGAKVTTLRAGTYSLVISDKASIHDFTLEQQTGGDVEKHLTSVPFKGTKTVTVTLKRGKWKYYCTPHESIIFGFFTVK